METLQITHKTVYRYARPVRFSEHRLMFRPRDSHDLRHVSSKLSISPSASVRWYHDVFNNSITIAEFAEAADCLTLESVVVVQHYGVDDIKFPIEEYAKTLPFAYGCDEVADLARANERHFPDAGRIVDAWAHECLAKGGGFTDSVLAAMTFRIKEEFEYVPRNEEGTRTPIETLRLGKGTCRDFALLMMEAARTLGLAARFVTGYLFDPQQGKTTEGLRGSGNTHAWVQVFLPGAGWVEYDPTNGLIGGGNLIRVAVTRDPSQATVVQGSYFGAREDFIDMTVSVDVERLD